MAVLVAELDSASVRAASLTMSHPTYTPTLSGAVVERTVGDGEWDDATKGRRGGSRSRCDPARSVLVPSPSSRSWPRCKVTRGQKMKICDEDTYSKDPQSVIVKPIIASATFSALSRQACVSVVKDKSDIEEDEQNAIWNERTICLLQPPTLTYSHEEISVSCTHYTGSES